ncbi:MAG: MerR family transcriptional regulator [Acidimicrobiales bacterium]|jgi:DNA-binding transcriptional MerR regulator
MNTGEQGTKQRSRRASSLTIGQLAAHVGVTIRAIRHYHACGLLAEPARDASGYRRYGAQAVVDLVRIKTLAEAGVPLARIAELLDATPNDFADAVDSIGRALGSQIRELQHRRRRLAQLTQGEHLYLPREVISTLDTERAMGVSERTVGIERDAWILVAALSPELVSAWAAEKARQLTDPEFRRLYLACDEAYDWDPDDPRLNDLATLMSDWAAPKHDPEVPGTGDSTDYLSVQLMTARVAALSPAWRSLNDLANDRLWPTNRAPSTPPFPNAHEH